MVCWPFAGLGFWGNLADSDSPRHTFAQPLFLEDLVVVIVERRLDPIYKNCLGMDHGDGMPFESSLKFDM